MDYLAYLEEAQKEWTPEKLKAEVLAMLRGACEFYKDKRKQIEIENAEARRKGVSYQERKKASLQLEVLERSFRELRARGIAYSRDCPPLHALVRPEDMDYIHSFGLEEHLRSVVTWVHGVKSQLPQERTEPVVLA